MVGPEIDTGTAESLDVSHPDMKKTTHPSMRISTIFRDIFV